MPRKKETLTLSVPPGTKAKLEAIADRLDIRWGTNPSPSGLVAAIAQQAIEVGQSLKLDPTQTKALRQGVRDLVDAGHVEEARSVLTLLIDRGQLEAPLRQELIQQISQPIEGWRIQVDQLIAQRQPFHLVYQNSQSETLEYTVWCEDTADSTDFPELRHNRCFRLDRIQAVFPISGEWRGHCDSIQVELSFTKAMVKAYETKEEDTQNEIIDGERHVTRNVINPFWLFREVRRYGSTCTILSPQSVRDRFKQELLEMLNQYNN
jgi:hypothetical protein